MMITPARQSSQVDYASSARCSSQACALVGIDLAKAAKVRRRAPPLHPARGEPAMKCPSPLSVLKYTYDHSCD